ncbi:DUF2066 domain-containing protein [Marinobacter mobilis]|uniref:DUF2066 domain-containing protein n=1 Tax=Marinobacter mobilis TaxID=488533 RepID=UPI001FE1B183|nr:DUF2066 domain-containing protein [Marinobacter mobilis]
MAGYAAPVAAVTVDGLYSVEVAVAGSAPGQLQDGYADGLRKVLLRVSGGSDVLTLEGVDELLANAESLLQSYQLVRGGSSNSGSRLRMTFGAVGVNQALSAINAPVWGVNRPLTLAWIAVQDRAGRRLISQGQGQDDAQSLRWLRAFQAASVERGLPLAVPPADVASDRTLLSEVWGQFMEPVRLQSEALGYDLLAAVRISFERNSWRASWLIEGRGLEATEQTVEASSPESLAQRVVGVWADQLAARYAIAAGDVSGAPQVDIVLDGLDSMADYAAAKQALSALAPVLSAGPVKVRRDQATLRVAFSGELSQLEEYMALDTRFVPVASVPELTADLEPDMAVGADESAGAEEPSSEANGEFETGDNEGTAADTVGESEEEAGELFSYQPLTLSAQEKEQAFESLYPVLHYRWQAEPAAEGIGQRE